MSDVLAAYGGDATFWADEMTGHVHFTIRDPFGRISGTVDGADWERFYDEGMDSLDRDLPISGYHAGAQQDTC